MGIFGNNEVFSNSCSSLQLSGVEKTNERNNVKGKWISLRSKRYFDKNCKRI